MKSLEPTLRLCKLVRLTKNEEDGPLISCILSCEFPNEKGYTIKIKVLGVDIDCFLLHIHMFFSYFHKFSYFEKYPSIIFWIT